MTWWCVQHPGGHEIILEYAGMDATAAFFDKGHSPDAHQMLQQYFIGILAQVSLDSRSTSGSSSSRGSSSGGGGRCGGGGSCCGSSRGGNARWW